MPVICALVRNCKSYIAFLPAVLLTVAVAVVSLWESPHVPRAMAIHDKLMHGLMYTVLAISWAVPIAKFQISNIKYQISNYLLVCLCVTAYGALIEVLQRFCTLTRSGEMADLLADFIGALIGVAIVALLRMVKGK
jgi:VanZ family protein